MVLLMTHVLYNDRRVSCPVCGANATVAYLHPDAAIYRCGGCTHVFSDPRSIQKHETYSTEYYEEAHRNWFQHPNVRLFRWIADQIPPQTRSVIDIGCGKGHFLRFLHSVRPALKLVGVDLSRNDAETGIEYYQGEISDVPITEKFDVVVSLAVIEHVADVSEFAKRLATLCRPEGQVLIMTLDNDSMLYRVARLMNNLAFRTAFNRLYSTHHLHHFTERSLRSRATGWIALRSVRAGTSTRPRTSCRTGCAPTFRNCSRRRTESAPRPPSTRTGIRPVIGTRACSTCCPRPTSCSRTRRRSARSPGSTTSTWRPRHSPSAAWSRS